MIKPILNFIKRQWRSFKGYTDCPCCNTQSLCFYGDNPVDPEGPPLITWWQCHNCNASSEKEMYLLDEAAKKEGYFSFKHYMQKKGMM